MVGVAIEPLYETSINSSTGPSALLSMRAGGHQEEKCDIDLVSTVELEIIKLGIFESDTERPPCRIAF